MKLLNVRAPGRFGLWVKLGAISIIFWTSMFIYISFFKSQLLKTFQKEDMNIENLRNKLAELARGFNQANDQMLDQPYDQHAEIIAQLQLDDGITAEARRHMNVSRVCELKRSRNI